MSERKGCALPGRGHAGPVVRLKLTDLDTGEEWQVRACELHRPLLVERDYREHGEQTKVARTPRIQLSRYYDPEG